VKLGFKAHSRAAAGIAAALALGALAVPALAQADYATIRIEVPGGPLVPYSTVTLPSVPVAPPGAPVGQTCAGNSVIGAIHAATNGTWAGQWSDQDGWSLGSIDSVTADGIARRWVVYDDNSYVNGSLCNTPVQSSDNLIVYPQCGASTSTCFGGEPLIVSTAATSSPGVNLAVQVWELTTTFNQGIGSTVRGPSLSATVRGPNGNTLTDSYYGTGIASTKLTERGPNTITATKGNRVPDRTSVCVTDGNDGYCGSSPPPVNPFNPYAFCDTTGNDGLCGTIDKKPPVGYINDPKPGTTFAASKRPRFLKGTVDSDPSEVDRVRLRLVRKSKVTVTTYVKRKVKVKRRVKGKLVTKRVKKRVAVRKKQLACFTWNTATSTWTRQKSCKTIPDKWFTADGTLQWQFEFLETLPAGTYTLDAQAIDGAGNIDSLPDPTRNQSTFVVK
jgi:hypothetical protein